MVQALPLLLGTTSRIHLCNIEAETLDTCQRQLFSRTILRHGVCFCRRISRDLQSLEAVFFQLDGSCLVAGGWNWPPSSVGSPWIPSQVQGWGLPIVKNLILSSRVLQIATRYRCCVYSARLPLCWFCFYCSVISVVSVRQHVKPPRHSTLEMLEEAGLWFPLWHPSGYEPDPGQFSDWIGFLMFS